jgi:hypothetical protein
LTQARGSEMVSIPTLGEILRADPQAFVEKYVDIAAIKGTLYIYEISKVP